MSHNINIGLLSGKLPSLWSQAFGPFKSFQNAHRSFKVSILTGPNVSVQNMQVGSARELT